MKKSILLFVCIALILPCSVLAKRPVKEPTPVEVIPKIVDANGKTVGYDVFSDSLAMNYNGQDFVILFPNGEFIVNSLLYESSDCSGTAYVTSLPLQGQALNLPNGIVNNGAVYISTDLTYRDIVHNSTLQPDGTCIPWYGYTANNNIPVEFLFYLDTEFQRPYKLLFGMQLP